MQPLASIEQDIKDLCEQQSLLKEKELEGTMTHEEEEELAEIYKLLKKLESFIQLAHNHESVSRPKFISLVLGENQDVKVMALMLIPSAAFIAFILWSYSIEWKSILTAFLAFDIFAGLMSNLQEKTHRAWKKQPRSHLIAFLVIHLTVYPLLVVLFQVSIPLMMFMLVLLVAKTLAFAIGTRVWH